MKPGNLSNQVPIPAARLKLDDERETTGKILCTLLNYSGEYIFYDAGG